MSEIRFSDGMKFNLGGDYRLELRSDGWYVVGGSLLCPVSSEEEGKQLIEKLMAGRTK